MIMHRVRPQVARRPRQRAMAPGSPLQVYNCPIDIVTGFHRHRWRRSLCDGVPLAELAAAERHAALRLQRRDDRRPLPRHRRRVRVVSARAALRAQGQLDAGDRAAAARPRQRRRRELRRRDRRRACAPASSRRRSSSPASARPRPSWRRRSISASRRSTPSRKGSSSASTRSRGARQTRARVALRVNPDIDARSHPHISTGLKTNKFGDRHRRGPRDLPCASRGATGLEIVGLHIHVGSQITDLEPLRRAAEALVDLAARAARRRHRHRAPRSRRRPRHLLRRIAGADRAGLRGRGAADRPRLAASPIILEPGRNIVAPAGRAGRAVVDVKEQAGRQAVRDPRRGHDRADSADALQRLPPHRAGRRRRRAGRSSATSSARSARAATRSARTAGCRGRRSAICWPSSTPAPTASVMASNYNRRTMPAEVLVERGTPVGHPPPPDDRRPPRARELTPCRPDCLIAFEGLDQSGKQTQAEALRDRITARRARCRAAVVPGLRDARSAPRSHGAARRARLRADVMQLLYVANRYE